MRTNRDIRGTVIATLTLALLAPVGLMTTATATETEAPSPATNLQATVVDLDAVKLTWVGSLDATQTVIRGKAGKDAPTSKTDGFEVTPDGSLLPSATATDLEEPNVPYSFAVFACNASGECAEPDTVTVNAYVVTATAPKDRVVYADYLNITGKVTDALTGEPVEYTELSAVALYPNGEGELAGQDLSRTGGTYTIAVQPTQLSQFGVLAMSDSTHLGGFGFTRPVYVSADTVLVPKKAKTGKLGTTFQLIGGAGPVDPKVPIVLQEKVKGKWKTVLKQKPNKNGITTFKVRPTTKGKHVYRVTRAATPGVTGGASKQLTITVT